MCKGGWQCDYLLQSEHCFEAGVWNVFIIVQNMMDGVVGKVIEKNSILYLIKLIFEMKLIMTLIGLQTLFYVR